jgi:glutaminyl-peptide cyclotransferase
LYESTGLNEKSKLLKTDIATGKILQELKLEDKYFGEGIAILNNKIYQLTYQQQKVFVYDLATFKKLKEFSWTTGEGWGMTTDGKSLILDNGGSNLYFVNPETFAIEKTVPVTDNYGPVGAINEMEYVDGFIYANIWMTDNIIKINPTTGKVEARMDLQGLLEKNGMTSDTEKGGYLNGIAYNPNTKTFYITGKLWPAIFEMKFN